MCLAIYAALLALLLYYSDTILEQYALSAASGENEWMMVALGWEILPMLWPAILLMMVVASALTLFISRRSSEK